MPRGAAARALKPIVFALCAAPLAGLVYAAQSEALGANPAEAVIRALGQWALRGLWLTLTITPLRELTGWQRLAGLRRLLGLWAFAYALLHLMAYAIFDQGSDLTAIARDIAQRPFILAGFTAWALLVPLAATSFNAAIRALGAARWRALHRLVYAAALIALLHFTWMRSGKQLYAEPLIYGLLLAVLLGLRMLKHHRQKSA